MDLVRAMAFQLVCPDLSLRCTATDALERILCLWSVSPTKLFTETWSWMSSYWSFKDAIVSRDPDMVVSVHPLCQLMPIWVVEQMNKNRNRSKPPIPFVTVVTDLGGAHSTWFDRRADAVFVPSEAVKKLAMKTRLRNDKIVLRGLPIRPSFWKRGRSKEVLEGHIGAGERVEDSASDGWRRWGRRLGADSQRGRNEMLT